MKNMFALEHHGIKGQKWGVRRFQNYDGTRIQSGNTIFVSGSSKTQNKESGYFRKKLDKPIRKELKSYMRNNDKIIVGDAPGIDRQVQDFLNKHRYQNVEVYGPGKQVRYSANKNWKTNPIDSKYPEGSSEWLAEKDRAMTWAATHGLAIVLENGGAAATRKNVQRLIDQHKDVKVFELRSDKKDDWIDIPQ